MNVFRVDPCFRRSCHTLAAIEGPRVRLEADLPSGVTEIRTGENLFSAFAELGVPDLALVRVKPGVTVEKTIFVKICHRTSGLWRRCRKGLVLFRHDVGFALREFQVVANHRFGHIVEVVAAGERDEVGPGVMHGQGEKLGATHVWVWGEHYD